MNPTPHTLHRRLVVEAMERNGWTLEVDDDRIDYRSRKRATRQLWTRASGFDGLPLTVTVYFNDAGHVSGYVNADGGGASVHGPRSGRGRGRSQTVTGPSQDRFTPAMCRDLLINNADAKRLTREDIDEAQALLDELYAS